MVEKSSSRAETVSFSHASQPKKIDKKIVIAVIGLIIIIGILGVVFLQQIELQNLESNTQISVNDIWLGWDDQRYMYIQFNIYNPSLSPITIDGVSVDLYSGSTHIQYGNTSSIITIGARNNGSSIVRLFLPADYSSWFEAFTTSIVTINVRINVDSPYGSMEIERTLYH